MRSLLVALLFSLMFPLGAAAQDFGPLDGTWEGTLSWASGPGLAPYEGDRRQKWSWRIRISGRDAQVFFVSGGNAEESKPGEYQVVRLRTNAVVVSVDSGKDDDGTWVETSSFTLTQKDRNTVIAVWTRQVNNNNVPLSNEHSKFTVVAVGELKRAR